MRTQSLLSTFLLSSSVLALLASSGAFAATTPEKKSEPEKEEHTAAHKKVNRQSALLVPPPPPDTPVVIGPNGFSASYSLYSIDGLTGAALQDKKKEIDQQVADLKTSLARVTRETDEKKERSQQFVGLFDEGIVSRRELEAAQDDGTKAERDLAEENSKLTDLEHLQTRVNERINRLSKNSRRAKSSKAN